MMVTPKTKTHLVINTILFVGAAVVVFFGWRQLHQYGTELETQVAAVTQYTDREQKFSELQRLIDATAEERKELAAYLLHEEDTIDFVTRGEKLAAAQNVEYTTDSLEVVENTDGYDELVVSFTMKGADADVRHMLKILEVFPHHGYVQRVQLNTREFEGVQTVTAKVELVVTLSDV